MLVLETLGINVDLIHPHRWLLEVPRNHRLAVISSATKAVNNVLAGVFAQVAASVFGDPLLQVGIDRNHGFEIVLPEPAVVSD